MVVRSILHCQARQRKNSLFRNSIYNHFTFKFQVQDVLKGKETVEERVLKDDCCLRGNKKDVNINNFKIDE